MNIEKIPAVLRDLPQWILWRLVTRDGQSTKVPFQVNGQPAKTNDSSTWATFAAVVDKLGAGGFTGPGFVFSDSDEFCGIDLDGCRDAETGTTADWARTILERFDSYSEISPSQTGVKVFVRGRCPWTSGKKFPVRAVPIGDKQPAIEVYDRGRYFAVTGQRLGRVSPNVEPRQEALDWLAVEYAPQEPVQPVVTPSDASVVERARRYVAKMQPAISGQSGHDSTFSVACALVLGFGLSEGEALPVMREYNQLCQPPWTERDLLYKLQSAARRDGPRNYLRDKPAPGRSERTGSGFSSPCVRRTVRDVLDYAKPLSWQARLALIQALSSELVAEEIERT